MPSLGSMRGRVVVVTGASSGIGRETALLFGRLGARVALVARRRELLKDVAESVREAGGRGLVVVADVGDARAARTAIASVRRTWKRIDVLVNNAGILRPARVAQIKPADLDAMLRVNLYGALFMTQAVLPAMLRGRGGSIVNVARWPGAASRRSALLCDEVCADRSDGAGAPRSTAARCTSGWYCPASSIRQWSAAPIPRPRSPSGRRASTCRRNGLPLPSRSPSAFACARSRCRRARRSWKRSAPSCPARPTP